MQKKQGFFLNSLVGLKLVMALSGVMLLGFVIVHMLGNLQIFLGRDAFNAYAHFLKKNEGLLWGARLFLLAALLIHVSTALKLRQVNSSARGSDYVCKNTVQASFASTTMLASGLLILVYIIYHLGHFTLGTFHPEVYSLSINRNNSGEHDVYYMTVRGFQNGVVALGYVLAMGVLFCHLSHAIASFFQTLGLSCPRNSSFLKKLSVVVAGVVFIGFVSIPISVQLGFLKLPLD
ncbi:MAG: succinate dehydrogenase cytochrome b subunit [Deltaproteobacteria bacterium]|nr:succinate dehydrogenase cytochrome b subunit [Deltaproteobacteria bacterium]